MAQPKRSLIFALLLILASLLDAQEHIEHEEAFVAGHYLVNESTIYQEFPFELILVFPVKYTTRNQLIIPSDFPGVDLEIIDGPKPRISHNELGNTLEYRYLLKAKRSGAIAFDSFALRTHDAYSRIAPFYVDVKSISEVNANTPQLLWLDIPKQIYQGESFKAQLILTNIFTEWPQLQSPELKAKGLIIEKTLPYVEEFDYQEALALRLGEWIFFAGDQGDVRIEPLTVTMENLRFTLPAQTIQVVPLPRGEVPDSFKSNAIGDFSLKLLYDPPTPDNIVHIRVQLTGEGALHLVDLPTLSFEGMQLLQKDQLNLIKGSQHGYSGLREESYSFLINEQQDSVIKLAPFSWFNPHTAQYIEEDLPPIAFLSTQIPFNPYFALPVLSMSGDLGFNGDLRLRPYIIALTLWLVVVLLLGFYYRPRKRQTLRFFSWHLPLLFFLLFLPSHWPDLATSTLIKAQHALENRQWQEAITLLEDLAKEKEYQQMQGAIAYNLAVAYHNLDDLAKKRFYLLSAMQRAPLSMLFKEAIEHEGLTPFIQDRMTEHRIFITLYWSAWLILLFLGVKFHQKPLTWRKNMLYLLLLSSVLIISLWFLHRPQADIAVVKEEIRALRIPDEDATYGEYIYIGEVFFIGGRGRSYIQLNDQNGKEGWVEENTIWILKR